MSHDHDKRNAVMEDARIHEDGHVEKYKQQEKSNSCSISSDQASKESSSGDLINLKHTESRPLESQSSWRRKLKSCLLSQTNTDTPSGLSSEMTYDIGNSESGSILSTSKQENGTSRKHRAKSVRFVLPEEKYSDTKTFWRTRAIGPYPNNNGASAVQGFIVSVPQVPSRRVMATSAFLASLSNKKVSVAMPPMTARGIISHGTKVNGRYFAPRSESILKDCGEMESLANPSDLELQFSESIQGLPGITRHVHPTSVKIVQTSMFIPNSAGPGIVTEDTEKVKGQLIHRQRLYNSRPMSSNVPRPSKLLRSDNLREGMHALSIGSKFEAWAANQNLLQSSVLKPQHQNAPSVSLRTFAIVPKQVSLRTSGQAFHGALEGNPKLLHSRPPSSS